MERKSRIRINILVFIITLAGFVSMLLINYNTYSVIIKDDIKNISKLTATNIYSDISIQLTKPIFVSLTMANDKFVQDWLEQEKSDPDSVVLQQKIQEYLNGIKEKYNHNSVFLISDYTKNYYHYNGINKVISDNNQHDKWYFDFINTKLPYDLDVDTDEVNSNKLSVFVNCRIVDGNNNLLGVTGVGLEMNKVQELLAAYKENFQLEAILFDKDGLVQIHSDTKLIQTRNLFDDKFLDANKSLILDNKDTITVLKYKEGGFEGYMISKYIEELDWYLLVKKDTSVLEKSFRSIILKDTIILILVLVFVLLIISRLIRNNNKTLLRMAMTDALTTLPNRRGFNEAAKKIIQGSRDGRQLQIFVLDIDNLKLINDAFGHLSGDILIYQVGRIVNSCIQEHGEVFRWGGDEFTGYITGSLDEAKELVEQVFNQIKNSPETSKFNATISMGITSLQESDSEDTIMKRADKALYKSKEDGKNRYTIM